MSNFPSPPAPFSSFPRWLRTALLVWFIAGILPGSLRGVGVQFLPAPEWVALVHAPATFSGIVMLVLTTWFMIGRMAMQEEKPGWIKRSVLIISCLWLGFTVGTSAVTISGPMLGAILVGKTTDIEFTAATRDDDGRSGCRSRVPLDGLPFMFHELCGVPKERLADIASGERIVVTGRGTTLGILPRSVTTFEE